MRRMNTSHHRCERLITKDRFACRAAFASCQPGSRSPRTILTHPRAESRCRQVRAPFVLAGRTLDEPQQRFTAVANSQQRSVAVGLELRHRLLTGSLTVLPKLAVIS